MNSVIDTDLIQVIIIMLGVYVFAVPIGLAEVGGFAGLRAALPAELFKIVKP